MARIGASASYRGLARSEAVVSGSATAAPALVAAGSFFILFREGLEVVLLLGFILAYLRSSGNTRLVAGVWYGLAAGIAATTLTYLAATTVLRLAPAARELLSGITGVAAVTILLYLSLWMLLQSDRRGHVEFMHARLRKAVQRGGLLAIAGAAFASVYREGFETVLLYQALADASGAVTTYLWLGLAAGVAALGVMAHFILRLQRRLPLRLFFRVAVTVTTLLAIAFAGNAAHELQGAGWLPTTNLLGLLPRLEPSLASLTGYHPTLETVLAQGSLIVIYALAMVAFLLRRAVLRRRGARAAAGNAPSA